MEGGAGSGGECGSGGNGESRHMFVPVVLVVVVVGGRMMIVEGCCGRGTGACGGGDFRMNSAGCESVAVPYCGRGGMACAVSGMVEGAVSA